MQFRNLLFKAVSAMPDCVQERMIGVETFPAWEVAAEVLQMELAWLGTICAHSPVSFSLEGDKGKASLVIRYLKSDESAFENVKDVLQNLYFAAKRRSESNATLRYALSAIERYAYAGNSSLLTDGLAIPGGKVFLIRPGLLGCSGRALSVSDADEELYDKTAKMLGMALLEKYARYVREIVSGMYDMSGSAVVLTDGTTLDVEGGKLLVTEPGSKTPHTGYDNSDLAPVIATLSELVSEPPVNYTT